MEKEIISRWESNKEHLKNYIKNLRWKDCDEYEKLVRILIAECLNKVNDFSKDIFDANQIVRIDHGDYQGTEIYLFHKICYQPSMVDYYIFDNYYGSCTGCDTLLSIIGCSDYESLVTDKQADELMTLLLHMVQRIRCLEDLFKEKEICE